MKKEPTRIFGRHISRCVLLIALAVAGIFAWAAEEPANGDVLQFDTDYTASGVYVKHSYSVVAPKTGIAVVTSTDGGQVPSIFTDSDHTTAVTSSFSYTDTGGQRTFSVTEGTTYYVYFKTNSTDTVTFRLEMIDAVKLKSASPTEGSVFDITGTGQLSVKFNIGVDIESASLTAGTATKELTRQNASGNISVLLSLKSEIGDILNDGVAKPGDDFTVTLTGVHATDDATMTYGDNGTLTLKYVMPEKPMMLNSKTIPAKFLSYWAAGDDDAKLTMTFSEYIYSGTETSYAPTATLTYGNMDQDADGEFYSEELTVAVSGSTLTVDFADKVRTPQTMTPQSDSTYTQVAVKIRNIRNADGDLCYTGQSSTTGSFTYTIPYALVDQQDVTYEFTPASGASLAEVSSIELFISGESTLRYDGVNFTYMENADTIVALVKNSEITRATEDDAIVLTVPVPEAAKTAKNVEVSLANLVCIDGIDRDITATYNPGFQLTLISPKTLELEGFSAGDSLIVTTNMNDSIGAMCFQIYDLNPTSADDACLWSQSWMKQETNATTGDTYFTYEIGLDVKMVKGHTYQLDIIAAASEAEKRKKNYIGVDTILFTGLTNAYEYSSYTLESISPDPDDFVIETTDQNTFDVEFSGPVTINSSLAYVVDGSGSTSPLGSITPTDDGASSDTKYSKKWRLTVSASTMSTVKDVLPLAVAAEDEQGRRVKGNTGTEAQTYFYFEYEAVVGSPDFTVTPSDGSTVECLDTITAEYSEGLALSYYISDKSVKLYDAQGEEVAYVASADQYIPEDKEDDWSYVPTQVILTLSSKITTAGDYTFVIPSKYFILGDGMNNYTSKSMTVKYTVSDSGDAELVKDFEPVTYSPDTLSTTKVQELSTVTLTFESNAVINPNVTDQIVVYIADGRTQVTTASAAISAAEVVPNEVVITLDEAITDEGTYRIVVPEGLFGNEKYAESSYTLGHCNPEFAINYEVGATANVDNVVADPADGSTVESLSRILLTFPDAIDVGPSYATGLSIEVRDAQGNKVMGATSDIDWDIEEVNKIPVDLDEELTTAGTYTVNIPAGFYLLNEGNDETHEINLTYTIGAAGNADNVTADPADGSTVGSLSRIVLTFNDANDVAPAYDPSVGEIELRDENGQKVVGATSDIDWGIEELNKIPVDLDETVSTSGKYTLHIPAGFYFLNEGTDETHEINLSYIISNADGISSWFGDDVKAFDVYDASGAAIMRNASREQLNTLRRGLYIVNGQKILVR